MTKKGISVLLYTALPAAVLLIGLFGKDRWFIRIRTISSLCPR